ncbi:MAG: MBL fold metallo-hydrolase, partial [Planctomycetota bacterium]
MSAKKLLQFGLLFAMVLGMTVPAVIAQENVKAPENAPTTQPASKHWKQVLDGVWMFEDSCNVYAVKGPDGIVAINAGTGKWLDYTDELPAKVVAVLCTHFFRDHSAGAVKAAAKGIEIHAPYWEQEHFADPLGHFQRRETFIIYDNLWDLYAPITPIPVTGWLQDWDKPKFAGLEFQVVPTVGVTMGAITLMCEVDQKRIAFCGELIHSYGKMARIAPLQYNYNDLTGAVNVIN